MPCLRINEFLGLSGDAKRKAKMISSAYKDNVWCLPKRAVIVLLRNKFWILIELMVWESMNE